MRVPIPTMSSLENITGQISILKTIYMWEIKRDYITSKDIGEMLLSPEFQAINLKWQLQLKKIKGDKEEWEDLSIFLILVSLERSIEIRFLFSLLNDRDENILSFPSSSVVFSRDKSKWGRKCIASAKLIERFSQMLSDDKLKISCEIIPNIKALQSIDVSIGFENLLDNESFSDVTFRVKDKHLHAHKNILASKSKVFEAMFEHRMRENIENIVDVEDVDYEVLLEMFRYMYSGKLKDLEKHSKSLLIAADKYDLVDLKVICGEYLCDNLSTENVVEYLDLADRLNVRMLKLKTLDFIMSNAKNLVTVAEFKTITDLHADLIFEVICRFAMEKK